MREKGSRQGKTFYYSRENRRKRGKIEASSQDSDLGLGENRRLAKNIAVSERKEASSALLKRAQGYPRNNAERKNPSFHEGPTQKGKD